MSSDGYDILTDSEVYWSQLRAAVSELNSRGIDVFSDFLSQCCSACVGSSYTTSNCTPSIIDADNCLVCCGNRVPDCTVRDCDGVVSSCSDVSRVIEKVRSQSPCFGGKYIIGGDTTLATESEALLRAQIANSCVLLARALLERRRVRAAREPLPIAVVQVSSAARDANLAAALAALALAQQQTRLGAVLMLSTAERYLGHLRSAVNRLKNPRFVPDALDALDTAADASALLLEAELQAEEESNSLWKPGVTPSERSLSSPVGKLCGIGKHHVSPLSQVATAGLRRGQLETAAEATRLLSSLKVDINLVALALADRKPHRAVVGSWNLRCSAGYHDCRKTLAGKLANTAALASMERWSVIALQEVPGRRQGNVSGTDVIARPLCKALGDSWRWIEVELSEDEVGGFAYDSAVWTAELLPAPEKNISDAYKRAPTCAVFTSVAKPPTLLALASVHLAARGRAKAHNEDSSDDDDDDAAADEVAVGSGADHELKREPCGQTESGEESTASVKPAPDAALADGGIDLLRRTRQEVEALSAQGGVAERLIDAARKSLDALACSDALAYVALLGDFNLSWESDDPFTSPIWSGTRQSAWRGLSDFRTGGEPPAAGFRALIADGRPTNAYEVSLLRQPHCLDNALVLALAPQGVREDARADIAPWPPALLPIVEGLETVVAAAVSSAGSCAELRALAESGVRKSVRDAMRARGSDHRAITIVLEAIAVASD